jgi:hypothetical protein
LIGRDVWDFAEAIPVGFAIYVGLYMVLVALGLV